MMVYIPDLKDEYGRPHPTGMVEGCAVIITSPYELKVIVSEAGACFSGAVRERRRAAQK